MPKRKHILIISRSLPWFDRGAGHLRFLIIIELMRKYYDITYVTERFTKDQTKDDQVYVDALTERGVTVFYKDYKLEEVLHGPYNLIIFEYFDTMMRNLPIVKKVRPDLPIIIDNVDVHFARELQMAEVHGSEELRLKALETQKNELRTYASATAVWTVTDEDKQTLLRHDASLQIDVIPTIHRKIPMKRTLTTIDRNTLLFIGGFWHQPNEDAMLYFCSSVFPLIRKEIPNTRLLIVGNAPTLKVKELANNYTTVVGWVPQTEPYLEKCHVSIAPLRYGAGMKGKVCEAMMAGIPVVTTSVGIQGIDVTPGEQLLLGDDPETFAQKVVQLLRDDDLHMRIVRNARAYMETRFTPEIIEKDIIESVEKFAMKNNGSQLRQRTLFSYLKEKIWK